MNQPNHERVTSPYMTAIPKPTSGPLWAGFGVTMMFAGLVTNWLVSAIGCLAAIAGFLAWARSCFPHEAVEQLPQGADIPLPPPVLHKRSAYSRVMLPVHMHPYRSGIWGGLAGGVAMAIAACLWGVLDAGSVWMPINLLVGTVVPSVESQDVAILKTFQPGLFVLACGIHLVACVFIGLLYAVCLPMMPKHPLLLGGVLGPCMWTGLLYATIGIVNPALEQFISWPWFFASQAAFGFVCGVVVSRSRKINTMTGQSIESRMGIERNEGGPQ